MQFSRQKPISVPLALSANALPTQLIYTFFVYISTNTVGSGRGQHVPVTVNREAYPLSYPGLWMEPVFDVRKICMPFVKKIIY